MSGEFYRTVIHLEILSKHQCMLNENVRQLAYHITMGDCIAVAHTILEEKCNETRMEQLLIEQGNDPAFFQE